jgi:cytochrome c peroxidase
LSKRPQRSTKVEVRLKEILIALSFAVVSDSIFADTRANSGSLTILGQRLFSDTRISADRKVSCATCHRPDQAFQDNLPTARGVFGQEGTRKTPSLLHVSAQKDLFWDGRRSSLDDQALDPLLNPREHGLKDIDTLLATVEAIPEYGPLFDAANAHLGDPVDRRINQHTLVQALAAFEAQLTDGKSPFEFFHYDGDSQVISTAAQNGWRLFSGRARCTACHEVPAKPPALFSDHDFHALNSNRRPGGQALADLVDRYMRARQAGQSLDSILLSDANMSELGRFVVTQSPADIGKFKTPSLRNVAITAPYMHDGSVATLREAVDLEIYYRGTQDGHPLILTEQEKGELVAFLNTLTSFKPPAK